MGGIGDAVSYTVLALGFVVLIFLGALVFVQATRRGSRRFKVAARPARRTTPQIAALLLGALEQRLGPRRRRFAVEAARLAQRVIVRSDDETLVLAVER